MRRGVEHTLAASRRRLLKISDQDQDDLVNFVMEKVYMDDDHDHFCSVHRDGQFQCLVVTLCSKNLYLIEKILRGMEYDQEIWYFYVVVCEARGAARQLDPIHATPWYP